MATENKLIIDESIIVNQLKIMYNQIGKMQDHNTSKEFHQIEGYTKGLEWILKQSQKLPGDQNR